MLIEDGVDDDGDDRSKVGFSHYFDKDDNKATSLEDSTVRKGQYCVGDRQWWKIRTYHPLLTMFRWHFSIDDSISIGKWLKPLTSNVSPIPPSTNSTCISTG